MKEDISTGYRAYGHADIEIDQYGYVRVDGVCIGRRLKYGDEIFLEIKDRNKARSAQRGYQYIKVSLQELLEKLQ